MNFINYPISIILPVYNAAKFLPLAIESILNQTFRDFEFIIINDGSTDDTENIILSYIHDKRIRYVKNEQNLKLIKTLNKGVDMSNGKYIARMDADDIALPTMIEECYRFLESHEDYSAVAPLVYNMDNEGKTYKPGTEHYSSEVLPYILPFENVVTHPGIMLKADVLKKYKYDDSGLVVHFEDHDCWNRILADRHKIYILPQRLLLYRINEKGINSLHGEDRTKWLRQRQRHWIEASCGVDFNVSLISRLKSQCSWKNLHSIYEEMWKIYSILPNHELRKEFTRWESLYLVKQSGGTRWHLSTTCLFCAVHKHLSIAAIIWRAVKSCIEKKRCLR